MLFCMKVGNFEPEDLIHFCRGEGKKQNDAHDTHVTSSEPGRVVHAQYFSATFINNAIFGIKKKKHAALLDDAVECPRHIHIHG